MHRGVEIRKMRHEVAEPSWGAGMGLLAAAGIIGPILFTATFVVQGLLRPTYSQVAQPVSALAAGPNGWVQDLNFLVFGALMIAYAVGLYLGVRPSRARLVGSALLLMSGIGLVLVGIFPARDASGAFSVGPAHMVGALMSFLGAGAGLIVISRGMSHDPRWVGLAGYVLASGIGITILFLGTGALAVADDAPLHPWAGLMQRATLAVWFVCTMVLASRLLRLRRRPNDMQASGPRSILG
jgi:hypothetical membrane protein